MGLSLILSVTVISATWPTRFKRLKAGVEKINTSRPISRFSHKETCRLTQKLPTLLAQQCWELLRPCWQCCANGWNNSQQCWGLHCIMGRLQPISLCKPRVMRVRCPNNVGRAVQTDGSNIVALRFGSCWLDSLTSFKLCSTPLNNKQQHAIGCANVRNT